MPDASEYTRLRRKLHTARRKVKQLEEMVRQLHLELSPRNTHTSTTEPPTAGNVQYLRCYGGPLDGEVRMIPRRTMSTRQLPGSKGTCYTRASALKVVSPTQDRMATVEVLVVADEALATFEQRILHDDWGDHPKSALSFHNYNRSQ